MSPIRPKMSISMPPEVGQFYIDGQLPKTPKLDNEELSSLAEPPPPPRQTYKVKRKRATALPAGLDILDIDHVIPTIEMSEATDSNAEQASPMLTAPNTASSTVSANGLLSPIPQLLRSVTPPKTPAARILNPFDQLESPAQEWGLINDSRGESRPLWERTGSIGSSFSDSSISSFGSSAFSTMSPESEATDPFFEEEVAHDKSLSSPTRQTSPNAKRAKTNRRSMWTPAMDDHLWITYMQYLSDPTLTPFKMLPGTAPPLGICHRVASKAKRTWREHKTVSVGLLDNLFAGPSKREDSPDTIRADDDGSGRDARQPQWPRSESETRRRLRALCKRRPSLSAHYQRLLRTKSPSPFQSSSSTSRSSEPPGPFSSVDMKISLITSTSASMQPDGPLAKLASDDIPARPQSQRSARPADWFSRIGRSQAHQKSLSLQSGLGLDTTSIASSSHTLASPFDEGPSKSHLLQSMSTTKSLGRDFNRAPFLDSPFEAQASTAPRSLKRRFRSDEEKPKRLPLQGIFDSHLANAAARHRGFSLGATSNNLASLFNPPELQPAATLQPPTPFSSEQDHEMLDPPDVSMLGPPGSRSAPRRLAEPTPRLGSPFMELPSSRQHNTFPRSFVPTDDNPQPFQQRLQELAAMHASQQTKRDQL